jgi:hypothetical protein
MTISGLSTDSSSNLFITSSDGELIAQKSDGTISWQKQITSTYGLGYNCSSSDTSGNVYAGGYDKNSTINYPAFFTKYNSSGTIQLQRKLTASSSSTIVDMKIDSSGNIYIAGQEVGAGGTYNGYFVAKYNSSGTISWQTYVESTALGAGSYDSFSSINLDSSGNIYVVSRNYGFIVKLDNSGNLQWQRQATDVNFQSFGGTLDSSGNVYVSYVGTNKSVLLKYNSSGTLQWQRQISKNGNTPAATYLSVDSSDNVYVASTILTSKLGILLTKYDTSGSIQWQRTIFNTSSSDFILKGLKIDASDKMRIGILPTVGSFVMTLPSDGGLTGTYTIGATSIAYAVSTYTESAGSLTSATSTAASGASTATSSTPTYSDSTSTVTITKVVI